MLPFAYSFARSEARLWQAVISLVSATEGPEWIYLQGKETATVTAYANSFELPTIQKALEYYPNHEEELSTKNLSATVTAIFEAEEGYVFFVKAQGHNGAIVLMVSVNKEGAIIDTLAIQQKETPDYAEDVFTGKYEDQYNSLKK